MFANKTLTLGAVLVLAAILLPINNVHARLSSKEWQNNKEPSPHNDAIKQVVLQIQTSNQNNDDSDEASTASDMMAVTSDINAGGFFHEDYVYSFHPTPSGGTEQQWRIQRIPKHNRKLQSTEVGPIGVDAAVGIGGEEESETDDGDEEFIIRITNGLLSAACVVVAALAAGLTMGLLSLDPLSLEIKRRASLDPEERKRSAELLPLLVGHSKRHRLLVSLLLMNSIANEALPLFLDELCPSKYASIIVSVTLVLFFGEIVPSAFFTGPNQVEVAAKLVPLVKFVMFFLTPIAVPIAKLLDKVLIDDSSGGHGHLDEDVTEGKYYNRTELSALVRIQYEAQVSDKRRRKQEQTLLLKSAVGVAGGEGTSLQTVSSHVSSQREKGSSFNGSFSNSTHTHHSIRAISKELTALHRPIDEEGEDKLTPVRMSSIHKDEITMIEGALTMTTKVAADVYTPLRRVYALPSETVLDEDQMVEIWARGFSRVPVYSPQDSPSTKDDSSEFVDISGIVGVLMVRQLIVVNPAESRPISTLPLALPPCISPSMHLVDLINLFQAGGGRGGKGSHLALVCARPQLATEALERGEHIPKEAGVIGIITLEDVVEELLQEEIYDETDRDLELSRWGVNKWKRFVKRKKARKAKSKPSSGARTEATPLLEK
eukprot:CAMPEP_0183730174 /NCGR_PEP_ID=MMETSP0737-20130205/32150_1 /TAXON_ID=385413 /ORGANISM="Thalassiosira miniscula, Strain CCMP1093" /LENGTH=657 /DNA_ID=CAMNT_0025962595 /DNA_START=1 /DNA_END=1974 /DNA_ORIENTATION=+